MTTDTIKQLGAEFHRAADSLADTMAQLDNARLERLTFLRRCSKDSTARLAAIKEEIRTLPEQIAKWDAEAARLESQTAEDLLRQALEAGRQKQAAPEPFRPGLPPERLRKVWAEWENIVGDILMFTQDGQKFGSAQFLLADVPWAPVTELDSNERYRPHGATWSRVEAMADEAERAVCDHTGHCDRGMSCGCKCHKPGLVYANDPKPAPPAPTLLDLTKLPPGTVCEALEDIPRWNGRTVAAGVRFTLRDTTTTEGDEFPMVVTTNGENSYCIPYVVPARVVEKGGEDAQG